MAIAAIRGTECESIEARASHKWIFNRVTFPGTKNAADIYQLRCRRRRLRGRADEKFEQIDGYFSFYRNSSWRRSVRHIYNMHKCQEHFGNNAIFVVTFRREPPPLADFVAVSESPHIYAAEVKFGCAGQIDIEIAIQASDKKNCLIEDFVRIAEEKKKQNKC